MVSRAETPNIAGMTSPEAPVAPRPRRKRPAPPGDTFVAGSTSIERAAYVPDLRGGALRPVEGIGDIAGNGTADLTADRAIVLLVHDGRASPIREAVQDGMAGALAAGTHLLAIHALPPDGSVAAFRDLLERYRPVGVVLIPPLAARADLADICQHAHTRCLRIGAQHGLSCDERASAALAVRRLVALGHARIGLVAGPETSPCARERELGYLDAMAEQGLDRGPALIVPGDDSFESGIAAGRLLLEISPRPTAILACSDDMAAGVLHAAAQSGVPVPEALCVVGFDDTPLARRLLPPLASVRLPWERIGHEAAKRIRDESATPLEPFEGRLMERESLGPLRQGPAAPPG